MTDDIIRKATTADYIETIDNLRAEVERLRSLNESLMENGNDLRTRCQKAEARIKELEANNKRLEAAFLKSETERKFYTTINGMNSEFDWNGYPECPQNGIHKEWFRQQAREALERIKEEREG